MTAHLNEDRGHSESEYLTKRSYSQNTTTHIEQQAEYEKRSSKRISAQEIIVKASLRPSPVLSRNNSFRKNKEVLNLDLNIRDDLNKSTESINKTTWNTPHLKET